MTTTSESTAPERVYVWTWLPAASEPVVAGVMRVGRGGRIHFRYGTSYLARPDALSLYGPELPLRSGWQEPVEVLQLPGCLRDGSPDAWGRRVIEAHLGELDNDLPEFTYMLESGSNRFGAIDFQASPTDYVPRGGGASLDDLHRAALQIQAGQRLPRALDDALTHGTSIGGARPKVTLSDANGVEWIAKLSSSSDVLPVVRAEAAALFLARASGLDVPDSRVERSLGRDVLLVRRFDRGPGGTRRHVVSGLTIAGQDEMFARYVTYPNLLDALRSMGEQPELTARELFSRIAFNIAISNSDDHARNHAAFWDGQHLALTPAYDLAPGSRSGETATQAMAFGRDGERESTFAALLAQAHVYNLSPSEARELIDRMVAAIGDHWSEAAEHARLTQAQRTTLWGRQFLNPGAMHGYR